MAAGAGFSRRDRNPGRSGAKKPDGGRGAGAPGRSRTANHVEGSAPGTFPGTGSALGSSPGRRASPRRRVLSAIGPPSTKNQESADMASDMKSASGAASPPREKGVRIFTYPKIIFIFPSLIMSLICWVGMTMMPDPTPRISTTGSHHNEAASRPPRARRRPRKRPRPPPPPRKLEPGIRYQPAPIPLKPDPIAFKRKENVFGLLFLTDLLPEPDDPGDRLPPIRDLRDHPGRDDAPLLPPLARRLRQHFGTPGPASWSRGSTWSRTPSSTSS